MMKLFGSSSTSFTTLGLGVLRDYKSDPIISEELNGAFTLEFEYSIDGYLSESLIEGNIVCAKGQAFRIISVEKDMEKIKILAKHIFFDLAFNFLEDVAPTNLNSQQALAWMLARTQESNNFSVNGDCSAVASARYIRKNVTDAIYNEDNCLLKRFGGELEINNFNIFVHAKRGTNRNLSIRYRKNLTGIEFKLDFSTVATRIMPQGSNELLLDEKYIDSPKINNYFTPIYKKIEFSDIGVDDNTTEEQAKAKLRAAVQQLYADGIDDPEVSVKIDFVELAKCEEYKDYSNLESCELGDTVQIIIPELNLNLSSRVVKTIYNDALGRIIQLELGTVTPDFVTSQSKAIDEMGQIVARVNPDSILSQAQDNAKALINHPFNGNILIDNSTGVLYLMDSTNPANATNVWKWSLGGLGFSSTGINGTYSVAITQDGAINANFITAGTISANRIEGYDNLVTTVNSFDDRIQATDQLVQDTIEGLNNTLMFTGGNNIFRNTDLYETNANGYEYWTGNASRTPNPDAVNRVSILLQNGSFKQNVSVPNGIYMVGFIYDELIQNTNASFKLNGTSFSLDESGSIEQRIEVTTNSIEIEFICDTNNGFRIYDLRGNKGDTLLPYSQNSNESRSDTVTIGKGITIKSDSSNTLRKIDADGDRTYNATTNELVREDTDEGSTLKTIYVKENAKITGLTFTRIDNSRTWISGV